MAKLDEKKQPKKPKSFPLTNVEGIKMYRCGGPEGDPSAPPEAIAKLMIKHMGAHGRIFPGGAYPNMPGELARALLKDGAVKEI